MQKSFDLKRLQSLCHQAKNSFVYLSCCRRHLCRDCTYNWIYAYDYYDNVKQKCKFSRVFRSFSKHILGCLGTIHLIMPGDFLRKCIRVILSFEWLMMLTFFTEEVVI